MTLGQKIKQARLDRGMTQKELVGDQITRNMLSQIENDSATPSVKTLEYLAGRLGLSASYLMSDLMLSDGTSPDGLDDMRNAYREGRFDDCIAMLENTLTAGTTDEGYLLRSLAALSAAREKVETMEYDKAKEYAESADYYNKQGLYYSAEIDAEMSLILAECANNTEVSEFAFNESEYLRAVHAISFAERYKLATAENALRRGDLEKAEIILSEIDDKDMTGRKLLVLGELAMERGELEKAKDILIEAEKTGLHGKRIYRDIEICCRELEDYKMAYHYATLQK